MCLLVESIKVDNGELYNIHYHNLRMNKARRDKFGCKDELRLEKEIIENEIPAKGLYKCRVLYTDCLKTVEFHPYTKRTVGKVKIVETSLINYRYKYSNRSAINTLLELKENCDDILISVNGKLADASSSNIVLVKEGTFYTPNTSMLQGTHRQRLLDKGKIVVTEIKSDDIYRYEKLYLINAMVELGDIEIEINRNTVVI